MNSILQLKGQFEQQSGNPGGGKRNLPVGRYVEAKHVFELIDDLKSLQVYWKKRSLIKGALISVTIQAWWPKATESELFCARGLPTPMILSVVQSSLAIRTIFSMFSHTM